MYQTGINRPPTNIFYIYGTKESKTSFFGKKFILRRNCYSNFGVGWGN